MWQTKALDNNQLIEFIRLTGFKEPFARLLLLREVKTLEAAQRFLQPKLSDLYSPALLPDIEIAVARIIAAIKNRERILIWGHEDLDGITSVVALYETLRDLQGDVLYYIPAKHIEPHGLNAAKVKNFNDSRIKLVITVDCGITNFDAVEDLANYGIDTVILEHHEVLNQLPKAKANVDPKRKDARYPFRNLSAVGVVLKVAMALTEKFLQIRPEEFLTVKPDFLSLVTLGTLADRVPLQDENRILVKHGLSLLTQTKRLAIKAILDQEQIKPDELTVEKFMNTLLPLFASANGNTACHFFLSQDYAAVQNWVLELIHERNFWREEVKQALAIAKDNLDRADGLIIVKSAKLPLKTMGHCAGKLREQYQVPVIVIGKGNDHWIGECRGVDEVDLVALLKANQKYFIDFGGHKKACGFSIRETNLESFIQEAKAYARTNFFNAINPKPLLAEAVLPLSELTKDFTLLGPFGEGNPAPLLIAPNTTLKWEANRLIILDNPTLNLLINSESIRLNSGRFDLLYTFDEKLNVTIKQATAQ